MKLKKGAYELDPGDWYGTPKELWGFLTPRRKISARRAAMEFLRENAELLGLPEDLRSISWQRTVKSLGASHVILQQWLLGFRVHRGYVTVHVGNDGCVYMAKNRVAPVDFCPTEARFDLSGKEAVRRARKTLGRSKGRRVSLVASVKKRPNPERMWFPKNRRLHPAWRVRLRRTGPSEDWIVYVNAKTGGILSKYDNLAKATGRAWVFDPSPVTAIGGHENLLTETGGVRRPPDDAYWEVTLRGLKGNGRLEGTRVTTKPTRASRRVRRSDHRFEFASNQKGFEEAMVYYHIDSAIRYLESLGFRGARAIFDEPLRVNVNGTREDNSWYSPSDRMLTFGTGDIDDAEDAETILHELGHAIQDAIIPDFGQSDEAAAIGEGFGDYFAASFFAESKPARYRPCVMTWDGLLLGLEAIHGGRQVPPPCLRRVDNDWTADDWVDGDPEHANGEIWSTTLWDIRRRLGGEEADRLILESHFQLDGFTTFARAARAIIDADRNLNGGANRNRLRSVFRKRRIGPL